MREYRNETEQNDMKKTDQMLEKYPESLYLFIRGIEFHTTPKTRLEYVKNIGIYLEYIADQDGIVPKDVTPERLEQVTKTYIEEYLHYLRYYERNGKVYTNSDVSIKRKLAALRSYYSFMFDHNMIRVNEMSKIKLPKLRDKEIIRMDTEETRDFVNTVQNGGKISKHAAAYHDKLVDRDLAITYLLLSTGIRISELVGLDMDDIDIERRSIQIIRKGGKESTVWFSDEASEFLEIYIEKRKHIPSESKALFLSSQKKRMAPRSVEYVIKKYARQAVPLKNLKVHSMRSSYASNLYNKTGDIYLVAEILGHSDISTTRKHYASLSEQRKKEARNALPINDEKNS